MKRSPRMQEIFDDYSKSLFNMTVGEAQEKGICVDCKEPVDPQGLEEVEQREYGISALCHSCQAITFRTEEE